MQRIKIDKDLYASDQPSEPELRTLSADGIRTVVDLREDDEDLQVPLDDERMTLDQAGIQYLHLAVPRTRLDHEALDRLRSNLAGLAGPVLIHSPHGRRSKAFALAQRAISEGWSGSAAVDRANEIGVRLDGRMQQTVREYVEARRGMMGGPRTTVLRPAKGRASFASDQRTTRGTSHGNVEQGR